MEDQRLGSAIRAIRVRRGWRQVDASAAAGISRGAAMRIEAGDLEAVAFGDARRYARALGARFEGPLRWHGADLDRLLNRGHAQLHEAMARWLRDVGGWPSLPEVSFSHRGDRGVIDVVAWHAASRTLLVIELKTRIADVNELMATMDIRRRVAPIIAREHGWNHGLWGSGCSSRRPGATPERSRTMPWSSVPNFRPTADRCGAGSPSQRVTSRPSVSCHKSV